MPSRTTASKMWHGAGHMRPLGPELAEAVCCLLLGLCLLHGTAAQLGYYTTKTVTSCFSVTGVPSLEFSGCQPGDMIVIQDAFQGVAVGPPSTPPRCQFARGDCVERLGAETEAALAAACVGRAACALTASVAWMPRCQAYSSYNTATYACVPQSEVLDVCAPADRVHRNRVGFLRSPGYPEAPLVEADCTCHVTTRRDNNILLSFADFSLEWSDSCHRDQLKITDGSSSMPRCGQLPRGYNMTSATHSVTLTLRTAAGGGGGGKGFLLQVEALGPMTISCGSNRPPPTTPAPTTRPPLAPPAAAPGPPDVDLFQEAGSLDSMFDFGGTLFPGAEDGQKDAPNFAVDPDMMDPNGLFTNLDSEQNQDLMDPTPEPHEGINPLIFIILGVVLGVIIVVVLITVCCWLKRRRKKKAISQVGDTSYMPRLTRHRMGHGTTHALQDGGGAALAYHHTPHQPDAVGGMDGGHYGGGGGYSGGHSGGLPPPSTEYQPRGAAAKKTASILKKPGAGKVGGKSNTKR